MAEVKKLNLLYKNIIGNTQETIEAIQRFLAKNPPARTEEEAPAESINKILNSVTDEEISEDIQKIIKNL